jgi:hypothetical protein
VADKETAGQLTRTFQIPVYAQDMLFIVTNSGSAQTEGEQGDFDLEFPVDGGAQLRWAAPNGPILASWDIVKAWSTLNWDGHVKIGGFIERLHAHELGGLEVVVFELVGGPFPGDHVSLPSLEDMRKGIFARPSDTEPLVQDQSYPLIVLAESNLAALAQDALVSGLGVDAYASLASAAGGWHEIVGLPLLLDSLTLLAP